MAALGKSVKPLAEQAEGDGAHKRRPQLEGAYFAGEIVLEIRWILSRLRWRIAEKDIAYKTLGMCSGRLHQVRYLIR